MIAYSRIWASLLLIAILAAACGGSGTGDPNDAVADTGADPGAASADSDDAPADPGAGDGESDEGATDEADTADPDVDEPVELIASWTGVTPDTIRLGVAMIDTDALEAFNVDLGFGPVQEAVFAWANAVNDSGGVNGRMVEISIERFLPIGSDSSAAACTRLIEDLQVFLVIGTFLDDNALCITELYETPYIGLSGLNDERQARSVAPYFAAQMDEDRQYRNSLGVLGEEGLLDGQRLALYWEAPQRRLANDVVLPLLGDMGVEVVEEAELPDLGLDVAATDAAVDVIMERFSSGNADVVLNLSGVVRFSRGIQRSGLDAQLIFVSGQIFTSGLVTNGGFDPSILEGSIAITNNTLSLEEWQADQRFLNCIDIYNASSPDEPIDLATIEDSAVQAMGSACRGYELSTALLQAAGPDLTPDSLLAAAESLGTFDLPGMPGASLGPGKYSAGNAVRFYEFDPSLDRFVPASDPIFVEG